MLPGVIRSAIVNKRDYQKIDDCHDSINSYHYVCATICYLYSIRTHNCRIDEMQFHRVKPTKLIYEYNFSSNKNHLLLRVDRKY